MSTTKYLDYASLQYYHQKLKLDVGDWTMTNEEVESICNNAIQSSEGTPVSKSMTIDYIKISLYGAYFGSGNVLITPVSWFQSNISIQSNTQYAFSNVINLSNVYYQDGWESSMPIINDLNGISIQLSSSIYDENEDMYLINTYSTIGKECPGFSSSKYNVWKDYQAELGVYITNIFSYDYWNSIDFTIPVGSYETFDLNYHLKDYDLYYDDTTEIRLKGKFILKSDIQVTLIHDSPNSYSAILYWRCVE